MTAHLLLHRPANQIQKNCLHLAHLAHSQTRLRKKDHHLHFQKNLRLLAQFPASPLIDPLLILLHLVRIASRNHLVVGTLHRERHRPQPYQNHHRGYQRKIANLNLLLNLPIDRSLQSVLHLTRMYRINHLYHF